MDHVHQAAIHHHHDALHGASHLHQGTSQRQKERVARIRGVFGRIPTSVPSVEWRVTRKTESKNAAGTPIVTTDLIGHVDNSAYPQISVAIEASFSVPANASGMVPMMLVYEGGVRRAGAGRPKLAVAPFIPGCFPEARLVGQVALVVRRAQAAASFPDEGLIEAPAALFDGPRAEHYRRAKLTGLMLGSARRWKDLLVTRLEAGAA
jgi:hypothetical protein